MFFFSSSELIAPSSSFFFSPCEVVFGGLVHKRVLVQFFLPHTLSCLCPKNQKKNNSLVVVVSLLVQRKDKKDDSQKTPKKEKKKKRSQSFERKTLRKEIIATVVEYQRRERIEKSRWPSPRTTRHTISRIKRTEMVREKSRVFLRVASWEVSPRSIARNRKCVGRGALLPGFHFVA
jgi:hypothetical protein